MAVGVIHLFEVSKGNEEYGEGGILVAFDLKLEGV